MTKMIKVIQEDVRLRFNESGKAILVIGTGLKLNISTGLRLFIKQGASGDNGKDGADGSGSGASPAVSVSVVNGTTYALAAGKKLDSISVVPASGDRLISVGYTAGAGDVLDNEDVLSNDGTSWPIGRRYHTGKTLHFSQFTGEVILYIF